MGAGRESQEAKRTEDRRGVRDGGLGTGSTSGTGEQREGAG